MLLRNVHTSALTIVDLNNTTVPPRGVVEVTGDLAKELLTRPEWQRADRAQKPAKDKPAKAAQPEDTPTDEPAEPVADEQE